VIIRSSVLAHFVSEICGPKWFDTYYTGALGQITKKSYDNLITYEYLKSNL